MRTVHESKVHLLGGPATKVPRDFSGFLLESENKKQLIRFVCDQWKSPEYAHMLHDRSVFVVCAESCVRLTSIDSETVIATSIEELHSTQEEADTRIILHCVFASQQPDFGGTITVRSPDTDVLVLLVHYYPRIGKRLLFDTGTGNNRRVIDVCKVYDSVGHDVASALPAFHTFTGCDSVSAFVSKGKKRPFQLLSKNVQHTETFQLLGQTADSLPDRVMQGLEDFVCCMYGYPKSHDTGTVRLQIFQSRYGAMAGQAFPANIRPGIDLSLLPPSKDCLQLHSLRANYQTFIWTHAHIPSPTFPSPDGCGWKLNCDNQLEIKWNNNLIMPQQLIDVLQEDASKSQIEDDQLEDVEEHDVVDNIIDCVFDDEGNDEDDDSY